MIQRKFKIALLSTLIIFISSCGEKMDRSTLSEIATQTFDINLSKDFVLVGEKGSIITIPKNCFGEKNVKVKIVLKECFDIRNMLFNNLSTTAIDKRILETEGMIFLEAFNEEGKRLKLQDKKITLQLPTKAIKEKIKCFYGINKKSIEWGLSNEKVVSFGQQTLSSDTAVMGSPGWGDSILNQNEEDDDTTIISLQSRPLTNLKVYSYDSLKKLDKDNIIISKKISDKNLVGYIFQISHLGWINLDKYIEGETIDILVDIKNVKDSNVELNLVLKNYNSIVVGGTKSGSNIIFKNVPKNEPFTLVAFAVNNGNIKYQMLDGNSNNNSIVIPELKSIERDEFSTELIKKFGRNIWNRPNT